MSGSFFQLSKTRHYAADEIPMSPEHTDLSRLTIDASGQDEPIKLTIQTTSTNKSKSSSAQMTLTLQEGLRVVGALTEVFTKNLSNSSIEAKSNFSNELKYPDIV